MPQDAKVRQGAYVERRRNLKRQHMRIYHALIMFWKPLVGKCWQCVKESSNEVGKNAVVVVCTNSHCKEEVVNHVQEKSP